MARTIAEVMIGSDGVGLLTGEVDGQYPSKV